MHLDPIEINSGNKVASFELRDDSVSGKTILVDNADDEGPPVPFVSRLENYDTTAESIKLDGPLLKDVPKAHLQIRGEGTSILRRKLAQMKMQLPHMEAIQETGEMIEADPDIMSNEFKRTCELPNPVTQSVGTSNSLVYPSNVLELKAGGELLLKSILKKSKRPKKKNAHSPKPHG
ncbi:hypothetical protein Nepgr_017957 [Nepenthes gracilis]|uniref:Uncharacterized protein n=1 Tax=Nepenthes gracilis TaxID=150966 RepID=A0AAD3STS1_NEPGR|nr:hypothetical protein Nepgr_017957 [Nepenthes gracilis]